jgi:hypothetical protein
LHAILMAVPTRRRGRHSDDARGQTGEKCLNEFQARLVDEQCPVARRCSSKQTTRQAPNPLFKFAKSIGVGSLFMQKMVDQSVWPPPRVLVQTIKDAAIG